RCLPCWRPQYSAMRARSRATIPREGGSLSQIVAGAGGPASHAGEEAQARCNVLYQGGRNEAHEQFLGPAVALPNTGTSSRSNRLGIGGNHSCWKAHFRCGPPALLHLKTGVAEQPTKATPGI